MNELWNIVITTISLVANIAFIYIVIELKKDKKNLVNNCKHFADDSKHYFTKFQEERAKHEFSKDDTLAKFLFKVIVQKQKMQIHEIDASFSTMTSLTVVQRMQIKNELLRLNWMESGEIKNG